MVVTPGSPILSGVLSRIAALHGSRCVSLMPLGEALPRLSNGKLGLPHSSEALIRTKTIVGVHVQIGYGAIASHMTRLTSRSISL
jgi:hypothetical protein